MNQKELIDAIKEAASRHYDAGEFNVVIAAVLDTLADVAHAEMQQGGEVTLSGIGKLTVEKRAARKGRNPATGEAIDIPAKTVPKFSAAKALKDAVNN